MTTSPLPTADSQQVRQAVLRLARAHRAGLAALLAFHLVAVTFTVASPWLFGGLLDALERRSPTPTLFVLLLAICLALLGRTLFTWLAQRASFRFGERVFKDMRNGIVAGVVSLPQKSIDESSPGDVLARSSNDIDAVSEGVRVGLPEVVVGSVTVVVTMVAAFLADWRVAIAAVVGLPVLVLATRWYVLRSQPAYEAELQAHAEFETAVLDTVRGSRTIDAFALEREAKARIRVGARRVSDTEAYTLKLQTRWFPLVQSAYYLPVALVVLWGGWWTIRGETTVGTVIAVALFVQLVVDPLDDLIYWADQLQLASVAFARIEGVSRHEESAAPPETAASRNPGSGAALEFAGVTYSYGSGIPVFSDLSLFIGAGTRTLIVGSSGAGKTTLGLLAAGLYRPTSGTVRVLSEQGLPACDASEAQVMLVTQESYVFTGTLESNLLLARPSASPEELCAALRAVGGNAFVDHFEGGLQTTMDDSDIDAVSRQRIALARVLLQDPDVVVLDEATASLSVDDAATVEQALEAALEGRTVITIAHRLHQATGSDRILVVEHGVVVEDGTHVDLMGANGTYSKLWRVWSDPSPFSAATTTSATTKTKEMSHVEQ